MTRIVVYSLSQQIRDEVVNGSEVSLKASPQDFDSWNEIDFMVFAESQSPVWVAKIKEVVLPRKNNGTVIVRFSAVNSLEGKAGTEKYCQAAKHYRDKETPSQLRDLDNDDLFHAGDEVLVCAKWHLSIQQAVVKLSEAYRVKTSQVKVLISSE